VFSVRSERRPRDTTIEGLLEVVLTVRSVSKLYNEERLRLRVVADVLLSSERALNINKPITVYQ
jgi:hypothetical protein